MLHQHSKGHTATFEMKWWSELVEEDLRGALVHLFLHKLDYE
jgi:hypothetical protein